MSRRYDNSTAISREQVDRLIDAGLRAPSAGFSQGWHFLVLDEPQSVSRYWAVTAPDHVGDPGDTAAREDAWLSGMRTAPVLIVVFSDRSRYEARYAQPDKVRRPAPDIGASATDAPDGETSGADAPTTDVPGTGTSGADAPGTDASGAGAADLAPDAGNRAEKARAALDRRWPVPYWHLDAAMAALLIQLSAVDAGLGCCFFGVPTARVPALAAAFGMPVHLTPVGVVSVGPPARHGSAAARRIARRNRSEVVSYRSFGRTS